MQKIKKAYFAAMRGTGAVFGNAGGFMTAKSETDEYISHQQEFSATKKKVEI